MWCPDVYRESSRRERTGMPFWPRQSHDAAIMNHIRKQILATLVGVTSFMAVTQPVFAQKIFVENTKTQVLEKLPDPELMKVLPLVFTDSKTEDAQVEDT